MFECSHCKYTTNRKQNYVRHLKSKKHMSNLVLSQELSESYPAKIQDEDYESMATDIDSLPFVCKYCDKRFKYKSGVSRHIKYRCKLNNDEDLKELVRLLNDQNASMQKQINQLTQKLQLSAGFSGNSTNTNCFNNIFQNNNLNLLNYNETDYGHLTNKDYYQCIEDRCHCVKTLIEKVHFNESKPENMNVYISSMKDKYIMVYKNNKWTIQNRKETIDDIYDRNEYELSNWYDKFHEKYPKLIKSFELYLENKENNDVVDRIKELILLEFYNNRNVVKNTTMYKNSIIECNNDL